MKQWRGPATLAVQSADPEAESLHPSPMFWLTSAFPSTPLSFAFPARRSGSRCRPAAPGDGPLHIVPLTGSWRLTSPQLTPLFCGIAVMVSMILLRPVNTSGSLCVFQCSLLPQGWVRGPTTLPHFPLTPLAPHPIPLPVWCHVTGKHQAAEINYILNLP